MTEVGQVGIVGGRGCRRRPARPAYGLEPLIISVVASLWLAAAAAARRVVGEPLLLLLLRVLRLRLRLLLLSRRRWLRLRREVGDWREAASRL